MFHCIKVALCDVALFDVALFDAALYTSCVTLLNVECSPLSYCISCCCNSCRFTI